MAQNLNRLLARPLTRILLRTSLSANQVTLLSLGVGLGAGPLLSQSRFVHTVIGALLFQLYYLLDNSDGEVARLKNQQSAFGAWFDIITDAVVHIWLYLWLFIWTERYHPQLTAVALLAVIGICLSYLLGLLARFRGFTIALNPDAWKESRESADLSQWLRLNLDNENFSLFLLLVVLLNLKIPFLWATAIGANFFWIKLILGKRRKFFPLSS